jgi:DNA modification methylase
MTPYYQDEAVTLYRGDCNDLLPRLDLVDHVITDPPYSRDLYLQFRTNKGKRNEHKAAPWDDAKARREMQNGAIGAIDDILEAVAGEFVRLSRRWMVIFHDAEIGHRWRSALGPCYVRAGVWVKPNAVPQMSGDRPGQGFESMTIGHATGRKRWNGGGRCAVWTHLAVNGMATTRAAADHPCPKPETLMAELVALFTDPGDTVLDPFAGSGTTGIAAKRLGRRAVLIEREERFCETIAKRLQQSALDLWEPAQAGDAVARSDGSRQSRRRAPDLLSADSDVA